MLKEAQLAPESTDRSLEVGWGTLGRVPKGGRLLIQALKDCNNLDDWEDASSRGV